MITQSYNPGQILVIYFRPLDVFNLASLKKRRLFGLTRRMLISFGDFGYNHIYISFIPIYYAFYVVFCIAIVSHVAIFHSCCYKLYIDVHL